MSEIDMASPRMPDARGVLTRLLIAAAVGALLVVCVVLPAEYRMDPTGFGRMTGLLELTTPRVAQVPASETSPTPAASPAATPDAKATEETLKAASAEGFAVDATGKALPVVAKVPKEISRTYPVAFRSDTVKIPLGPDGELEYKVFMKPGGTLVYSWQPDQGTVYYDFHGEPADPKKSQSYLEVQETASANGAFVAPFEGIHGWYWLNLTSKPQVITLKMSGYYELRGVIK